MTNYIAARSGVVGLTRALTRALGAFGIRVNAISPKRVLDDAALEGESRPGVDAVVQFQSVKRVQAPDDTMGALLFHASSDSDFVRGQVLTVDGGRTIQ